MKFLDILVSCQLYCSAKSLSCFTQDGKLNFGVNFRIPSSAQENTKIIGSEEGFTIPTEQHHRIPSPIPVALNAAQMPITHLYHRNDMIPTSAAALGTANTQTSQNIMVATIATNSLAANGMYKPPHHI